MDVSPRSTALFVVVVAITCVAVFLSCGPGGDDEERRNRSRSTPLPTSRTRLLHPSTQPDSYSRGQTNGRPPAAHNYHHHFYRPSSTSARTTPPNLNPQPPSSTSFIQPVAGTQESSAPQNNGHNASRAGAISSYAWSSHGAPKPAPTDPSHPASLSSIHIDKNMARATATAGYGNSFHRIDLASHYVGKSGQIPSTSNHAQDSYHQWPTRSHVAEATVTTKSNPTTTDHEGYGLRPNITAPYSSESRATLETSACTDISHPPPQLTSSHINTTTMADITNDVHSPRLSPPFSEESSLSGLVSPRIPTQPSIHTSSSGRLDISSSSRLVPHPSPVPGTHYGDEVEAVASAQELKAARELRERGRRCKREIHVARDLAKSARKSGDYKAEQRHKHDAMAYESQMKDLDKRAAKIIFRENNKVQKEGTVDLHGLYVPEALEYAKKELQSATYRDDDKVCFIVGRGLHSDGGQSKLRPRLQELCDERGLLYSPDPRNPGKLIVQLH